MSTNTTNNGGQTDPWQEKELGVFWKRTKNGTKENYLSGVINLKKLLDAGVDPSADIQVVAFTNKKKQKDTHPDLRLYVSEPRGSAPSPTKTATTAPARKGYAKPAPAAEATDSDLI